MTLARALLLLALPLLIAPADAGARTLDRRAAIRIARREGIDVVLTTSPPSSVHLVGAAVKRATGARWIADLRDSLVAHPHRRAESALVRMKEQGEAQVAKLVARQADAIDCAAEAIARSN